MTKRSTIPDCRGAEGDTGAASSRSYSLNDTSTIDNFHVCEVCYEGYIAWNGLGSYFTTLPSTKPVGEKFCLSHRGPVHSTDHGYVCHIY